MKKGHVTNRRPPADIEALLNRAKHSVPKAAQGHGFAPESTVSMIATGKITREMSCDGKKRFRTYQFAESTVRPALEAKYGKLFEVYACAFCNGFHLATRGESAA